MKTFARLAIIIFVYPIFYWLDRHVVPSQNVFWHSYAQDLMMPGLIFLWILFNGEMLFDQRKLKFILTLGVAELMFGAIYEYGQYIKLIRGTGDKWDVLCYAISIALAMLIFQVTKKDECQKI